MPVLLGAASRPRYGQNADQKSRKPQSESGEEIRSATTAEPIEFEVLPDLAIPDNDEHGLTIELIAPSGIQGTVEATIVVSHEDLSQVKAGVLSPTGEFWELVAGDTFTGDTFPEHTVSLNPQPVGDLGGTWKLVVTDLSPEKPDW